MQALRMKVGICILVAGLVALFSGRVSTQISKPSTDGDGKFAITGSRIQRADTEPGNWMSHGRTYDEQRFSPLSTVNADNVGTLGLAWAQPTGSGRGHEASPIVVDGVMFLTLPWSKVLALDAATGARLWEYDPGVPPETAGNACCDVVNRGAAVWKGALYFGTLDGRLVALDAATGRRIWETQTTDRDRPYTITGAPRIVDDKVIIGNGGAELGVRGYVSAYDSATGELVWRFYTVPGNPDLPFEHPELEAAAKTWTGQWWEIGGGGTAWDSMAYDPELDTLYVGTGNGSPWNREIRSPDGGDNLFLSSILALEPDTGKLKWHYQVTPADSWDYTATQHIILADLKLEGQTRKVLMQAPKNGFFYVLDRETGELISAEDYVEVTWASGVDLKSGRPIETELADYSEKARVVKPSPFGGHNWHPMAYNPQTGLVYIPVIDQLFIHSHDKNFEYRPGLWNTGTDFVAVVNFLKGVRAPEPSGYLRAWDPIRQREAWSVKHAGVGNGGVLTTAGNLVFQGTSDGAFSAYRAEDGKKLWESRVNVGIVAPPISYSIGSEQYIAVLAGWGGVPAIAGADAATAATATHINAGYMLAYKLGGTTAMPVIETLRFTTIPPPPVDTAPREVILQGERLFHRICATCHGIMAVSSRVLPDLRFSSKAVHDSFSKIVRDGVLAKNGMPGFAKELTEDEVNAIRSYIIDRARTDRELQLKSGAP